MHLVLANPGLPLSTASVYRRFDESGERGFGREGLDRFLDALRAGEAAGIIEALRNDLEASCRRLMPEADRLLEEARSVVEGLGLSRGEGAAMVSGSGPTVFVLLAREEAAAAVPTPSRVRRAAFAPRLPRPWTDERARPAGRTRGCTGQPGGPGRRSGGTTRAGHKSLFSFAGAYSADLLAHAGFACRGPQKTQLS